jgi:hypothetical protein
MQHISHELLTVCVRRLQNGMRDWAKHKTIGPLVNDVSYLIWGCLIIEKIAPNVVAAMHSVGQSHGERTSNTPTKTNINETTTKHRQKYIMIQI